MKCNFCPLENGCARFKIKGACESYAQAKFGTVDYSAPVSPVTPTPTGITDAQRESIRKNRIIDSRYKQCASLDVSCRTCGISGKCSAGNSAKEDMTVSYQACRSCVRDPRIDKSDEITPTLSRPCLYDRYGTPLARPEIHSDNVFLILSGPSLNQYDHDAIRGSGFGIMAVNNAAGVIRPHMWTHVDRPGSFHNAIWQDPDIMKFTPQAHSERKHIRAKDSSAGTFSPLGLVGECPSVSYYRRNEKFDPSAFFHEPTFCWGNHSEDTDVLGIKGGRSVMFVAIKLLYYLGFKNIFLIGCDLKMKEDEPYAFPQGKSSVGVASNNNTYYGLSSRLSILSTNQMPELGMTLTRCNPTKTMPYSIGGKIEDVFIGDILNKYSGNYSAPLPWPCKLDLEGWYDT